MEDGCPFSPGPVGTQQASSSTVQQHKAPKSAPYWCPSDRTDHICSSWTYTVNSNRKSRISQLQISRRSSPNNVVAIIVLPNLMFSRRLSNDHFFFTVSTSKCVYENQIDSDLETSNFTYFICKLFPEDFIYFFFFIKSLSFIENQFSVI